MLSTRRPSSCPLPSAALPPRDHRHSFFLGGGRIPLSCVLFGCCVCALLSPSLLSIVVSAPFCSTSSSRSSPLFFAWRWQDRPPPVHLLFGLAVCRVSSCRSTSASASRLHDALLPSRVLSQCKLCLSSSRGATDFRDIVASCMLARPLMFASRSPAGCRDASASRPLDAPPPSLDAQPLHLDVPSPLVHWRLSSLLHRVCRLVVASPLAVPPLLRVTYSRAAASRVLPLPPPLCLHRLVVVSHLDTAPVPPIPLSTRPLLDGLRLMSRRTL